MIQKRQFLINALSSAVQVVVTGGAFFVLYRFVIDQIGMDTFGVWALVMAMTTTGAVANLGLASSAVKFVSQYLARGDLAYVGALIQTAITTLGGALGVTLLAFYPLLHWVLVFFVETPAQLPAARSILPYAVASFWLNSVAGVVLACIDGHQRVDLRSVLLSTTTVVYLALAFVLVPRAGLIGLAQAQVIQAALLTIAAWGLLRYLMPQLPPLPYRWSRAAFSEMLGYSLKFQVISLSRLLFEPVTKLLIMKFGGAAALGHFEFAYRMVFQLRALIVTAHQSIVPTIADVQEKAPELIRALYHKSLQVLVYLIAFSLPFLLALTPIISRAWIGSYVPTFVLYATLLFAGWFINILSGPAYFANLGTGHLRWNVVSHLVTGLTNVAAGILLGLAYGGTGVVVAFCASLVTGSLILIAAYQHRHVITLREVLQRESLILAGAGTVGLALSWLLFRRFSDTWSWVLLGAAVSGTYFVIVIVPLWLHPVRSQVQHWLGALLFQRATEPPPAEP